MAGAVVRRFQDAIERDEDAQKMKDILGMVPKEEIMTWKDENGLDLLHHCILRNSAEAVELLLKQGYFVRPHEPKLNLYTHLASFLGFRTTLSVLLLHRPDDFRIAKQPLFLPPGYIHPGGNYKKTKSGGDSSVSNNHHRLNSSVYAVSSSSTGKERTAGTGHHSVSGRKGGGTGAMDGLVMDGSSPLDRTPLEVAARMQHGDCVRLMLSVCVLKAHPDAPSRGCLTLAALHDCPEAIRLLLKEHSKQDKKTATDDFKAAVEVCVQRAHAESLDLLLGHVPQHVDPRHLFKQINFFHVMYAFSASFGKDSYGRLPEATRVLIKRGHDVNAKLPSRTYPLYTLLTHAFCYHDYSFTQCYVQCLRLLLENGADPNFDEVRYEKRLQQKQGSSRTPTITTSTKTTKHKPSSSSSSSSSTSSSSLSRAAAGRKAYSSALHCLLETVEMYAGAMESKALAVRFVEDCAEVLVRHKADMAKVGAIGDGLGGGLQGNVLQQYAKSSVTLGVDRAILRCILRFGAEPDVKVNGKYALNVYFDTLFDLLSRGKLSDTGHRYENDVNHMIAYMCDYMSSAHIMEAGLIFSQSHARSRSEQVKYYIDKVQETLERRSRRVRPLQKLAAWRVWQACGKRADIVRNLPVKVELKTMILPLL